MNTENWVKNTLENLSIEQKLGQLFFAATFINASEEHIQKISQLIQNEQIGGLAFFHSEISAAANYEKKGEIIYNPDSILRLVELINHYQSLSKIPLLISIDAEWGLAMRIEEMPQFPYAMTLGAIQDNQIIYEVGKKIGEHCRRAGVHINFAPVLDVNTNAANPVIGYRAFGENPEQVSQKAIAYMKGMQSVQMLTCGKHFPGHGDTNIDSHLALPSIDKTKAEMQDVEFYTFREAIKAGLDTMMSGHISLPKWIENSKEEFAASLSPMILKDFLQQELGFEGIIFTDALNMKSVANAFAAVGELELKSLQAGNDVLLYSEDVEGAFEYLKNKLKTQELPATEIHQKSEKILKAKAKLGLINTTHSSVKNIKEDLFTSEVIKLQTQAAEAAFTLLKEDTSLLPLPQENAKYEYVFLQIDPPSSSTLAQKLQEKYDLQNLIFNPKSNQETFEAIENELGDNKCIIIAIYPNLMKPLNNFGMLDNSIRLLNKLIKTQKVIIYLLGNPYSLSLIDGLEGINTLGVTYQYSSYNEEVVFSHLQGNLKTIGKLPVSIGDKFRVGFGL